MPRRAGHDKAAVERRNVEEGVRFNAVLVVDECDLLELLIVQEMRRRESPSDRLVNARERVARVRQWCREIVDVMEGSA